MATNTNQVSQHDAAIATPQSRARTTESALRVPVDIFEDSDCLRVMADMPGVSRERLNVRVDGNTLLLEGSVQFDLPEKSEAIHAEVRASVYRRSFVLSRELDTEQIQASLKDGVLTVHIPKRAALRARKIEVQGS